MFLMLVSFCRGLSLMSWNHLPLNAIFRRISHRTHHQNHGHVEKDESWHPVRFLSLSPLLELHKLR
jgi:hypothetical protein